MKKYGDDQIPGVYPIRSGDEPLPQLAGSGDAAAKAEAFDRLVADLAERIPPEVAIKKLYGLPLALALDGFVIVPKAEWEQRQNA